MVLACAGAAVAGQSAYQSSSLRPVLTPGRRIVAAVLGAIVVLQLAALLTRAPESEASSRQVFGIPFRATNGDRLLCRHRRRARRCCWRCLRALVGAPAHRAFAARSLARAADSGAVALARTAAAIAGRVLPGLGLYSLLYDHVPGFEGCAYPHDTPWSPRLFLAIASGYGVAASGATSLSRRGRRRCGLGAVFIAEVWFAPMLVNQTWGDSGLAPPPRVEPAATAPRIYHALAAMPGPVVARRISVRRSRVGAPLRLLLDRALEAPRQRLQRRVPAKLQGARRAPAARQRGSRGGDGGAARSRHDTRHRARTCVCRRRDADPVKAGSSATAPRARSDERRAVRLE